MPPAGAMLVRNSPSKGNARTSVYVEYAEFKAVVAVESLSVIRGDLPRRAQELILDWAELHKHELLEDWALCQSKQQPKPIEPLR